MLSPQTEHKIAGFYAYMQAIWLTLPKRHLKTQALELSKFKKPKFFVKLHIPTFCAAQTEVCHSQKCFYEPSS